MVLNHQTTPGSPRHLLRWLTVAHAVEMVALAVWIGGLIVIIGSVIPAVFNSFNMEMGGRFLTRVFDGYNRLVLIAMAAMAGAVAVRAWAGRTGGFVPALPSPLEAILFGMMVLVAVAIVFVLTPQTVTLQENAFGTKDLAARKAAYDAFFRMHMVVRGLYLLNLGLGIGLVAVKIKCFLNNVMSNA